MAVGTLDLGLPHLTVVDKIGRGGFSVVYKAVDTKLNRPVAVKVLTGIADQGGLERFEQECHIHGPLSNHPNIVTIHDAGLTPTGSPFLVMEYLDGGSITDHLAANGPLPWRQAIEWLVPICDAVESAHRMGVLHRDIKPANILLDPAGPKLADFGIACVSDATSPQFAVSWLHAPPESELNRRDERSDVYSLASTLYELLTGAAPFWREGDESLAALLTRLATAPVPHLSPATAPPFLDQVLQRALAKDPADRPATAAELGAALLAGLEGSGVGGAAAANSGSGAGQHDNATPDGGATTLLPTATEILPAVALSPLAPAAPRPGGTVDTNDPVHGSLSRSGPAGGGPLAVGGPSRALDGSGSPTTAGRPVSYPVHSTPVANGFDPYSIPAGVDVAHRAHHHSVSTANGGVYTHPGAHPPPKAQPRRSKKLPLAAAIVAIATVGFLLSPAWAALNPASAPEGNAVTESTTSNGEEPTATTSGAVSTTEPAPTETTDDSSPDTTEDPDSTDTTDDPDTTDTTEDPDSTDTTDDTTGPTDPPIVEDVEVPDVANLDPETASAVLSDEGFTDITTVEVASPAVDAGLVITTDPGPGTLVDPDDPITIRVSTGPQLVTIPVLVGDDPDSAVAQLEALGLEPVIEIVELEGDDTLDGLVTGTFPGGGEQVERGSTVVVGVGEAPVGPVVTIDPQILPPGGGVTIPSTTLGLSE